jgi:hypothetical protein
MKKIKIHRYFVFNNYTFIIIYICIYIHLTKNLPRHYHFRLGGSKQTTLIKKITGNKESFVNELRAVLSISADDNDSIRMRASGSTIEVNGNRAREIKTWLSGLGF